MSDNMKFYKKIVYRIEYACALFALFIIDHCSLKVLTSLTRWIAKIVFLLFRRRRKIAIDNILKAGITDDKKKARKIAQESFIHFAILVLESLRTDNEFNKDNWLDKIDNNIPESTLDLLKEEGKGVILLSGHFGNWEVAGQLVSFLKPVLAITKNMSNPYVDALMQKRKPRGNFRLTPKRDKDSGRFLRALKQGEVLALLADQSAGKRGIRMNFFGREASIFTSPALFHLISKAPIVFGYCIRTGSMKYRFVATKPMVFKPSGNRLEDQKLIMGKLNDLLEDAIRLAPEQYLWAHRRWKK